MGETQDPLIKHYTKDEETGEMYPVRYMSAEEIEEREALRIANVSSVMRQRAIEELSRRNGH